MNVEGRTGLFGTDETQPGTAATKDFTQRRKGAEEQRTGERTMKTAFSRCFLPLRLSVRFFET
jgi:hypothetical protein